MSLIPHSDPDSRLPMDRSAVRAAERYAWAWSDWMPWDAITSMVLDLLGYTLRLERRAARAEHELEQARTQVAELEAELLVQEELPLGAAAMLGPITIQLDNAEPIRRIA